MKVKKKSDKPFWTMEVVCSGNGNASKNGASGSVPCGSTLEIGLNDIFAESYFEYPDGTTMYFTIKCSECGSLTDIPEKELPSEVKPYALAKKAKEKENAGRDL